MKLFHSPTSPYVRKVMVLLHESSQLDDVVIQDASGTPLSPAQGLAAKNPLSKVPALERADGPTLYDSRVICAYLDDRANSGLYPKDARRWDTLTLEATADGILDAALAMTYEARLRPENIQWQPWVDAQWDKISRACTVLNARWISHLTASLDMGQIAVACALGYVDLRHDARGWRNGNDALTTWYHDFAKRPSMIATAPQA